MMGLQKVWKDIHERLNWAMKLDDSVLGMNSRFIDWIHPLNPRADFPLADQKLKSKSWLEQRGFPAVKTLDICEEQSDIKEFIRRLKSMENVVLKPGAGSQGQGILLLRGVIGEYSDLQFDSIETHVLRILFGAFSLGGNTDIVFVEPLLENHPKLLELSEFSKQGRGGLLDLRVIVVQGIVVMAMVRIPTQKSKGKANLHQGAIAKKIDLPNGKVQAEDLQMIEIPFWDKINKTSQKIGESFPLKYLGLDWVIAPDGPKLLEINARPGLEIQNICSQGLKEVLYERV